MFLISGKLWRIGVEGPAEFWFFGEVSILLVLTSQILVGESLPFGNNFILDSKRFLKFFQTSLKLTEVCYFKLVKL